MNIILIPGLWLTARSWDAIVPKLEEAGHTAHPLTLPGMESVDADRSGVTRQDHVDTVVQAIDSVPGDDPVLLVGHSMGGVLAWAAAAVRLDRVAGVVFLASEPGIPGEAESMFPVEGDDVPLPAWDFFDAEMTADLDDATREAVRSGSVPSPVHAVTDGLDVGSSDGLHDLPVLMITAEYDSAQLREWTEAGEPGTEEIARLRDVRWADLHSGHWPQFTRVADTARLITDFAAGR